ncbi:translation initiation factor IF-2 [Amylibacter sp.]|jgi:translation initiation factor IF-2|nr:translation initiation factor IF-2 [Amylibacter sp.]MDB4233152.1 translation initiation factor IF-2 [bacterium]MDA8761458.1 translation initiation factor IF-2 [Amylibacter sp.]MDA9004619.1 translation initiation factor IF-2 [Amylibacter sp.]MDA9290528.1 translation initiation factor IF-2 [Amylibacter sp.]|tara:strand:- start:1943 stop:4408 length:2466 start_codon:yes stop_codon:yes gene_type:complete
MSDDKKPLGLRNSSGPGHVKQSFSHGRSKSVVVEKKRKRVIVPGKGGADASGGPRPAGVSDIELDRRKKALMAAAAQENDRKAREEAETKSREAERAERRKVRDEKERVEEERVEKARQILEDKKKPAETLSPKKVKAEKPIPEDDPAASQAAALKAEAGDRIAPKRDDAPRKENKPQPRNQKGGDDRRRSGKLTINQALGGGGNRQRSLASIKRKQDRERRKMAAENMGEREKVVRDVQVPEAITVQELANRMAEKTAAVVKALMTNGIMATQNQTIDADTAELIIEEFGHKIVRVSDADVEDAIKLAEDNVEDLKPRAPVVTIMGHVDHGKTSVLDALRKTNVASGEAGGITQHIGAYQITTENGTLLSFLDTPGHAAFTSMRARGAQVTDIVVLVVAANDGVMPQTIEAIAHAKAANVPLIIAINKMDHEAADPMRVRTDLLQHSVVVEAMSGEVQDVEISALKRTGLDELLEAISLQSELLELKANPDRAAHGAVIEAKLDTGRGPVATVLVKNGTLRKGDIFVVGEQWGKVRALINDQGKTVTEAKPSVPVEVLGLNGTPAAGDVLNVVTSEAEAREIADYRLQAAKDKKATAGSATTLDQLMAKVKADQSVSVLPIVVKADVQGSTEAIVQAMEKIGNEEVRVSVLHSGVGAITESDVTLAEASGAPIIGFNVRANAPARASANQKGVELRYYSIIYDLVDDIKAAASGLLSAEVRETFIGYAKIKEVFKITGVGKIGGCEVTEGLARRAAGVRLLRDDVVIHEGKLKTLKRFKDEVKDVHMGQECGMAFENYEDIRVGDVIEIFETEEIERKLD